MLKINGLKELNKKLSDIKQMEQAKAIVKVNGAELNQKMVKNAVFTRGYSTGQTKRSIHLTMSDDDMTAKVQPTTEYAPYVEHGTRFMSAQPFVKPSFNQQKEIFKNDLRKLVK